MSETRDTYILLRAFVDELARCGVAGACTSPGSRSTPLVLSLARDGAIPVTSHVDERASGFFALGLVCWMYTRPVEDTVAWIEQRFGKNPMVRDANLLALKAGYNFGETAELFP